MDTQDCFDNPWVNYLGTTNLSELENNAEPLENSFERKLFSSNAKLPQKDMHVYGYCPTMEEILFVKCRICRCILLPSVLESHIDTRHKNQEFDIKIDKDEVEDELFFRLPKRLKSCSTPAPPQVQRSRSMLSDALTFSALERSSPVNLLKMTSIQSPKCKKVVSTKSEDDFDLSFPESASPTELLHRLELSLYQQAKLLLPDTSSSIPSTSSDVLSTNNFMPFQTNVLHNREAMYDSDQSNQPSSTTTLNTQDNVQEEKKTPVLKLVLRRVPQSGENSSDEKRKSVEGQDGSSRKKSSGPYFMVVKNKESSQNLLNTGKQLLQQSHKVYHEKNIVDKNLKYLNKAKDKLIAKLLMELQSVKKKLNQSKRSKQELRSKLLMLSEQLKEIKRICDSQCEALSSKNYAYEAEIKDLKCKLDQLSAQRQAAQMQLYKFFPNGTQFFANDSIQEMAQRLQSTDQQRSCFEKRLRDLEAELLTSNRDKEQLEIEIARFYRIINAFKRCYLDCQNQYEGGTVQHDNLYQLPLDYRCPEGSEAPVQFSSPSQSNQPESTSSFSEEFVTNLGSVDFRTYHRGNLTSSDTNDGEIS